jgi:hypothetical protein
MMPSGVLADEGSPRTFSSAVVVPGTGADVGGAVNVASCEVVLVLDRGGSVAVMKDCVAVAGAAEEELSAQPTANDGIKSRGSRFILRTFAF